MNRGYLTGHMGLDRLSSGPIEWSGRLTADPTVWELGPAVLTEPPAIDLRAEANADGGVRLRGELQARVELECRRCLDPVAARIRVELDLRFDPAIGPEDETVGLYALDPEAAELDLMPALREELLLCLPEFPLCAADCAGLCPVCGSNRNREACGCRTDASDPRWDILRQRFPQEPDAAEGAGSGTDDG